MTDYRASFDAVITFSNGGDLSVHGFRVDLPSAQATREEIAALFVASLGLLMTDEVVLSGVEVFAEPHKGTRGGPSDSAGAPVTGGGRLVDLTTPATRVHLPAGGLELVRAVDLPAVVVRLGGARGTEIGVGALAAFDVRGRAVLLEADGRALTDEAQAWLAGQETALVGVDALFAGSALTAAGIPVVEALTALDDLPPLGARFTAAPPVGDLAGPVAVRAFARLPY
ncbi:hypothetical protein [Nonomuraea sediminis]|uniref:hypothetical protein n=1 Tax=Nonomuraea sediminis TaxID=2835864 RepID=UPI001BDC8473|nr:hypothetical protein [Nonomuraea sediminis]